MRKVTDVFPKVEIKLTSRARYVPYREITVRPEAFRGQRMTRECGVLNTHEFEMTPDDTTRTVACFGTTLRPHRCAANPDRVQRETTMSLLDKEKAARRRHTLLRTREEERSFANTDGATWL